MYYLQSRYYNPEIGRFINADAFASTGQGILGNNMFAYCGNNPVNRADSTGTKHVDSRYTFAKDDAACAAYAMVAVGAVVVAQDAAQTFSQALQEAAKEIYAYAKMLVDYATSRYADHQPRVHHVIPKGDFTRYGSEAVQQMQQIMHRYRSSIQDTIFRPLFGQSRGLFAYKYNTKNAPVLQHKPGANFLINR